MKYGRCQICGRAADIVYQEGDEPLRRECQECRDLHREMMMLDPVNRAEHEDQMAMIRRIWNSVPMAPGNDDTGVLGE